MLSRPELPFPPTIDALGEWRELCSTWELLCTRKIGTKGAHDVRKEQKSETYKVRSTRVHPQAVRLVVYL